MTEGLIAFKSHLFELRRKKLSVHATQKTLTKKNPLTFFRKIMVIFVRITEKHNYTVIQNADSFGVIEGGTDNYHRASNGYYTVNHNDHKLFL